MVDVHVDIVSTHDGAEVVNRVEKEDDAVSLTSYTPSTTSSKRKAGSKNLKILKIVNMIFEKKKKDKVTKLETAFSDGSKQICFMPFFNF